MANKFQFVSELADHTAHTVTRNAVSWKSYLDTASRLYKYSFDDQLLLYAQRPDATACASMELWNNTMRRWVKPGTKGIALIRKGPGRPHLEYVFDVSDTRPVRGARAPYLWEMTAEKSGAVAAALERQYGPSEETDIGLLLMEQARRAVNEVYRDHLEDLRYDTRDSLLEELDDLNLEVRYRNLLTASVQYTILTRCGLDPSNYLEDGDLAGISEFSTPAALHHLGDATSKVSMKLLNEVGRAVRIYDREQAKNKQKISEKPLAKSPVLRYTEARGEFSAVKRESAERSIENGRADLQAGGRLPDPRPGTGWGGRAGGNAPGQVRDAAADLSGGTSPRDVHLHAADRAAVPPSAGDRPAGAGAGEPDGGRSETAERRGRGDEGQRSDGLGPGGEQLHPAGGGDRAGGNRLQVNPEEQAAGEQPAASASAKETVASPAPVEEPPGPAVPDLSLFSLFPTVEEQVENIAQVQAEDRQMAQQQLSIPAEAAVPEADIGRALTSGGNNAHSIERIVAFFQKSPTGSAAASFMKNEFGEGGKGVTIAGQDYAIWFNQEGLRIAPGRSAFGPGSTLVTWVNAAAMTSNLLRDGMFATQDKINAARDNEFRELSEILWYLRRDFSDQAKKKGYLPAIAEAYAEPGFPDGTKAIGKVLMDPHEREKLMEDMRILNTAYKNNPELLRFRQALSPVELATRIEAMGQPITTFRAIDSFIPSRASFITEDEITRLLTRGPNISESKLRIYSYFVQGHNPKECANFLKKSYGDGGHSYTGYDEWHGSKGIRLTRGDDFSGKYDTVSMNWNQVQKRIRALIDSGQYLNEQEKAHLPAYDKLALARKIYAFNYYKPDPDRTYPHDWDPDAAKRDILPLLDDPEQVEKIFNQMLSDFVPLSPNMPHYTQMQYAIRDMGMYQGGESPLFSALPESALEEERQVLRREKEGKRAASEPQRTTSEAPPAPGDRLAAAARALAKKRPTAAQEDQSGQFSLFSTAAPVPLESEPPAPAPEPAAPPQEAEHEETSRSPWWDGYNEIKWANPNNIVLFQIGDFYEVFGEDAKTAAALLDLNLTTRPIAGVGRVEMCGVPVHAVEQYIEKLREFHSVTLAPVEAQTGERQPSTLLSQQEQAIKDSGEQGWKTTVAERNCQTTVIEAEAPLLARLMQSNGISAAQFVHDNGDVTFSFAESDRDAVEKLIAKLRTELAKAVESSYPSEKSQKPGRAKVELNYRTFAKMFPEIARGEYRYLRLGAGETMMPLHLQWINSDVISIRHTYMQNGDVMCDPEMTFRVDREKGTLEPLTFRQDGAPRIYQEVYSEPGIWFPKLSRALSSFTQQWLNNISQQRYQNREATVVRDGEDVRLTFDQDGRAVEPMSPVSPAGSLNPEQPEAGAETPPAPETAPELTEAGAPKQAERAGTAPGEPNLTPNVDEYLNLKAQHPDKLVGVQAGDYTLFYGKDAEAAATAMGTNLLTRDIPGLGSTSVTGTSLGWQSALVDLLEHGHSVVMARPDPEHGSDAPYEIVKERDAANYIPLGMELTIDGRRMKIDSVDFQAGTVSLQDLDLKGWFPIFRSEPIPFVRQFVEEVQRSEEHIAAEMADQLRRDEAAAEAPEPAEPVPVKGASDEIPVGTVLTIDGHRMKIDSVDKAGNDVMLLDLDAKGGPPMFIVRPAAYVRRQVAEAQAAGTHKESEVSVPTPQPEAERVEIDGGKVTQPRTPVTSNVVGRYDAGVFEVVVEKMRFGPEKHNFHITDDNLGVGGEKTKYQYNVTAIRTLKQIEGSGRLATPEEQEILSRYVGWGGIAKAFDPDDPKWAKEYAELKELLTPAEYESARSTVLNAHYARFVP